MGAHAIEPAGPGDAGEILTLQRAAYVTEAQLYDDVRLPALTQSLEDLAAELDGCIAFKAVVGRRVVGAVRAHQDGGTLHVGRLTVAPDQQGRGIGSDLLRHVEQTAPPEVLRFALFTGHLSLQNLRLYERHGYRETHREELHPGVTLVHLAKPRSC